MRFILGLLIGVALGAAHGRIAPARAGKGSRRALRRRLQPEAEEASGGVAVK